ncbi:hypothetical protein DI09_101p110 [Mitosporidium daphniae]|uniref:Uncharacterized protein n=1 Tax=Mitosporidium daphniae TaxID=1485682 RepID=A0A098VZQ2_9MICR|nr:uncharacterized protein DI09_101p110 [Mitosporidium daphniae]KGG53236.1 hypothetical protein DI09_101p110 [Mitosporidium daphniae]|eukprot:XP_013239672.1 uncharacterized protein DI09_101p110 [Mitosporidium daphniae]
MNSYSSNESDTLDSVSFNPLFENGKRDEEEEIIPSTAAIDNRPSTEREIPPHPEIPSISALPPRLRFKYEPQISFPNTDPFDASGHRSSKSIDFSSSSASSDNENILVRDSSDIDISSNVTSEAPRRSLRYLGVNQPKYRKEAIIDDAERNFNSTMGNRKKNTLYSDDELQDDDSDSDADDVSTRRKRAYLSGSTDVSFRRFSSRARPQVSYKENDIADFENDNDDLIVDNSGSFSSSSVENEKAFSSSSRRNRRSSIVDDSSDIENDPSSSDGDFEDNDAKDYFSKKKSKSKAASKPQFQQPFRCLDGLVSTIYEPAIHIDRIMDHIWLSESQLSSSNLSSGENANGDEEELFWIDRLATGEAGISQRTIPSSLSPISMRKIIASKRLLLLIKWKDRSHWWNSWVPYHQMSSRCQLYKKADIYIQKHIIDGIPEREELSELDPVGLNGEETLDPHEYTIIGRELLIVQWRSWMVPEKILSRHPEEVLIKWCNLPYSESTWESTLDDWTFPALAEAIKNMAESSIVRFPSTSLPSPLITNPKNRPVFVRMEEQPAWIGSGNDKDGSLVLRDYQLAGLNWLSYAWHRNINTLLADEMGLGKTIQSVALIVYLFEVMEIDGPFIVIVPLSTIQAWKKTFEQWAPASLRTLLYLGDGLSRKVILDYDFYDGSTAINSPGNNTMFSRKKGNLSFNVLLTTYELVMKDKQILGSSSIKWSLLVVDEAHRLKNVNSLLYRTLREEFSFANRLLITGTPLQNSIQELYALLSFLEPDKFKMEDQMLLSEMMSSEDSSKVLEQLHTSLKPHFLRRLKKDVEKSLPMKQERILRVELSPLQKRLYKWILTRNYSELNRSYGNAGTKGSASLLNIVNELRKASSHPYLFSNSPITQIARDMDSEGIIFHSGKMVLLDALLKRLLAEEHRILIFSQSVLMLNILSEFLTLRCIRHCRLDGGTSSADRNKQIERFNSSGAALPVFLLSTRAGGLGINLTTADTVILFDSDWNPQNDLQAMARCHRIGQTKAVSVYRLVSKGTVEEQILERAKKKMVLDHLVIQKMDRSKTSSSLTSPSSNSSAEFQKILQFGAKALFQEHADTGLLNDSSSLFAQIMITNSFDTSAQHFEDDSSTTTATAEGASHSGTLQLLFSRPASTAMLDLDTILIKAEDNLTKEEVGLSQSSAEDESFLDSFRVADLSGALAWSEIIPKSELALGNRVAQEESDRIKAMELQQENRKRGARATAPMKREEREKPSLESTSYSSTSSGILTLWNASISGRIGSEVEANNAAVKSNLYPQMRWVLYQLSAFGHRGLLLNHEENKEQSMLACKYLNFGTTSELNSFLCEKLEEILNQLAVEKNSEEDASVSHSGISSSKVFGLNISPVSFLKRLESLDLLFAIASSQADSYPNVHAFLCQKKITLKTPVNWSIPWQLKDDAALLCGVVSKGYGNWIDVIASSQPLSKKVKLLGKGSSFKGPAPTEEHLKRRADYLLTVLLANRPEKTSKKEAKKEHHTCAPKRSPGVHQQKLEFRPKRTAPSQSSAGPSNSDANLPAEYRKIFKRLFLPVKTYLLMLDDNDENDKYEIDDASSDTTDVKKPVPSDETELEDNDELVLAKERSILFNVGMHIDSLLLNSEEAKEKLGNLSSVPRNELHDLLWSFVYTCWSSSAKRMARSEISSFSDLSQLYTTLAST